MVNDCNRMKFDAVLKPVSDLGVTLRNRMGVGGGGPANYNSVEEKQQKLSKVRVADSWPNHFAQNG